MTATGLALDVGERRIGVARANLSVRLASPLTTLSRPESFVDDIIRIAQDEAAAWIVIGLPRGMNGQDTAQTELVRLFGAELQTAIAGRGMSLGIHWIDEALTSAKAEAELAARSKDGVFTKADVDALAATYILEDFLQEHP